MPLHHNASPILPLVLQTQLPHLISRLHSGVKAFISPTALLTFFSDCGDQASCPYTWLSHSSGTSRSQLSIPPRSNPSSLAPSSPSQVAYRFPRSWLSIFQSLCQRSTPEEWSYFLYPLPLSLTPRIKTLPFGRCAGSAIAKGQGGATVAQWSTTLGFLPRTIWHTTATCLPD